MNEGNWIVRQAVVADATDIARLLTELGYPTSAPEMKARLGPILAHPEYVTFVTEAESTLVGMAGARLAWALEFSGPYGQLTALVVDRTWRGRGIGRELVSRIEEWLRAHQAHVVILASGTARDGAHQFYRKLDYEETGVRFRKSL